MLPTAGYGDAAVGAGPGASAPALAREGEGGPRDFGHPFGHHPEKFEKTAKPLSA